MVSSQLEFGGPFRLWFQGSAKHVGWIVYYMMDCFKDDGTLADSFRVAELTERAAIKEAARTAVLKRPAFFQLRSVSGAGEHVFFDSRKNDAKRT